MADGSKDSSFYGINSPIINEFDNGNNNYMPRVVIGKDRSKIDGNDQCIIGIHTSGGHTTNKGVRYTSSVRNWVRSYY